MFVIWVLPYGLISAYDTAIGQEFIPSNYPKLSVLTPSWLPSVWFALGIVAFVLITFEGAFRIAHKYEKEQNRTTLEIIGGITNDMFTGKQLLEKLKKSKQLDMYLKEEYDNWLARVGECMQREQYSEFIGWFTATYKHPSVTLEDMIESCDKGITQLSDIHRRLTNSLTPHKKGSQT